MASRLSVVIPCFNETRTLEECVARVRAIAEPSRSNDPSKPTAHANRELELEIVIVDDASTDDSLSIANRLAEQFSEIRVLAHARNQGKGAALRTGFAEVTGDFVAVQDADLEYDPRDLLRLIEPLEAREADVVFGSRYRARGANRVLYFWHSLMNRTLTLLSNCFTDLDLTDMETCYKVFRRDIIQSIEIEEDRFGFEPEIVAKLADRRLRIYETGIHYSPRTYDEGKKIGAFDGLRALYCIIRYNAHSAPVPIQFLLYCLIGGFSALVNLGAFALLHGLGVGVGGAAALAFAVAAFVNYLLCVSLLFYHSARWTRPVERLVYAAIVVLIGLFDVFLTKNMVASGFAPMTAKIIAAASLPILNFAARRYLVFRVKRRGPWLPTNAPD